MGQETATALALAVHELATNALNYGALSVPVGTLDISGTMDDATIVLSWAEQGAPDIGPDRKAEGYGSTLVRQTIEGQLGSAIDYDWTPKARSSS